MAKWVRFDRDGQSGFGVLDGEAIIVHDGDMFDAARPTARSVALADVRLLTPCEPGKMVGLWNNFRALATKFQFAEPAWPLYFLKSASAFAPTGSVIPRPASYGGRILFEGELGIVIGRRCAGVGEAEVAEHIFGYTCVNDVTALDVLNADASFPQWARAKSFDGFGIFGPVIETEIDPQGLFVRSLLDGRERQNYPVADMIFAPHKLVSLLSQDMTLLPGDVIACGTSLGALSLKPGSRIEVSIDGIGTLSNVMA